MTENMTENTSQNARRWEIVVPGIALYCPPIRCERASEALRRAKQIAAAHRNATVDLYRDGEPVFAIGASRFGGCCADATPSRLWSEYQRLNP